MSTLKDLEIYEKPREKLKNSGIENLNDIELLALLLRSGGRNKSVIDLARELIHTYKDLENLAKADIKELQRIKHIGVAKATSLKAAFELAVRIFSAKNSPKSCEINCPQDVHKAVYKYYLNKDKEELRILCLNARNKLIENCIVSIGSVNESIIHPREVFKAAVKNSAVSIILVHNHPSGDTTPSKEDFEATDQIEKAGKILGINLIDHVIVFNEKYTSIRSISKKTERG